MVLLDAGRVIARGTPAEVFTEERIRDVYRVDVRIIEHPTTAKPHVLLC